MGTWVGVPGLLGEGAGGFGLVFECGDADSLLAAAALEGDFFADPAGEDGAAEVGADAEMGVASVGVGGVDEGEGFLEAEVEVFDLDDGVHGDEVGGDLVRGDGAGGEKAGAESGEVVGRGAGEVEVFEEALAVEAVDEFVALHGGLLWFGVGGWGLGVGSACESGARRSLAEPRDWVIGCA